MSCVVVTPAAARSSSATSSCESRLLACTLQRRVEREATCGARSTGSCREQSFCESESGQGASSATSSPLTHLAPRSTRSMIGWTTPCPSRQRPSPIFFLRLSQWRLCELRRVGSALAPDSARTAAFRPRRVAHDKPVDFRTGPADADAAAPLRRAAIGGRRGAASRVAGGARARAALRTHYCVVVLRIGRFGQQGRSWFGPRRRMRPSRCAARSSRRSARGATQRASARACAGARFRAFATS